MLKSDFSDVSALHYHLSDDRHVSDSEIRYGCQTRQICSDLIVRRFENETRAPITDSVCDKRERELGDTDFSPRLAPYVQPATLIVEGKIKISVRFWLKHMAIWLRSSSSWQVLFAL